MRKCFKLFLLVTTLILISGCGSDKIALKKYEQSIKDQNVETYSYYDFKDNNKLEFYYKITLYGQVLDSGTDTYTYTVKNNIVSINDGYDSSYKISGNCLIDVKNENVKYCY